MPDYRLNHYTDSMAHLFDYLAWRGDLSFAQDPFNPVDALIFCQLSYLPFDNIIPPPGGNAGISIAAAAEIFSQKHKKKALDGYIQFKDDPELLQTLGGSNRFKDCMLHSFVNNIDEAQEKQFCALCINNGEATGIAYRGTDVSLVGWKEDLNMSFIDVIPSQREAVSYLETIAHNTTGPLLVGGHSKGGNLAVYAASSAAHSIQKRIKRIYTLDAPGFDRRMIASEGYQKIKELIISYIPQSSVIGLLFEHGEDSTVIQSSQTGLLQHDLYSWELRYNDMVKLETLDQGSRFADKTLKGWINSMDTEHRQQFVEALFAILSATQAKSLLDLGSDWFNAAVKMLQSLGNIDPSTRKVIRRAISALFKAAKDNFDTLIDPQLLAKAPKFRQPRTRQAQHIAK